MDGRSFSPVAGRRDTTSAGRTAALLHAHVPLTLLLDLACAGGPDSPALYVEEPGDCGWLRAG